MPGDDTRYRCASCGNVTRFDVVERVRARRFYHYTLAGDVTVDEEEVLESEVETVTCRWCATSTSIEIVPRLGPGSEAGSTSGSR